MVRLLIFLVIVVLIQFLLTWVLTHYGLIVLGACSWWIVESLERTHSCLARRRLLRSLALDGYGHLGVAARTFPHVGNVPGARRLRSVSSLWSTYGGSGCSCDSAEATRRSSATPFCHANES